MPQPTQTILTECPTCHCHDLFLRKNFPQKLGLSIVLLAAIAFLFLAANPTTFHLGVYILLIPVIIDGLLYLFVPKITVCYRCRAEYAGPINPAHHGFELATGEKYRTVTVGHPEAYSPKDLAPNTMPDSSRSTAAAGEASAQNGSSSKD